MAINIGICPKCFVVNVLQGHHVLPRRFFGRNEHRLYLCEKCHVEIEAILPRHYRMSENDYYELHKKWLAGSPVLVVIERRKNAR